MGNSNQFAQAACQAVADLPSKAYNPLFIYGGVGLGKTHLLHAVGHQIARSYPHLLVLYLSSERFTNELINAIRYDRTAAAAHDWDGPMSVMQVRPAHPQSYEAVFHASEVPALFLPLRHPARDELRDELVSPRLERAIGVVYRPQTEIQSHYFHAILPRQFDEYVWFDETRAVRPVTAADADRLPRAHPFATGTTA